MNWRAKAGYRRGLSALRILWFLGSGEENFLLVYWVGASFGLAASDERKLGLVGWRGLDDRKEVPMDKAFKMGLAIFADGEGGGFCWGLWRRFNAP